MFVAPIAASVATLLLCAALAFLNGIDLVEMEFGGGSLTGLLVRMCLLSSALFLLCAALALSLRKRVAPFAVVAAAACLPLYIRLIAPRSLDWLSAAPSSVQARAFLLDGRAVAGLLSLVALGLVMVAGSGGHPVRRAR